MIRIRRFEERDRTGVLSILDTDAPSNWRSQFQSMHGTASASTLIAERNGTIVGVASTWINAIHPGRIPVAIEVASSSRCMGIGTRLLEAIRRDRSIQSGRPFSTKIFPGMDAGLAFVLAQKGEVYQTVPGFALEPQSLAEMVEPGNGDVIALSTVAIAERSTWFSQLYEWMHAAWSPIASASVIHDISLEIMNECDAEMSFMGRIDGEPRFVAFAFPEGNTVDVVAESIDGRHVPSLLVSAVLWHLAAGAVRCGLDRVSFDSHVTDPNIHPFLSTIPGIETRPVYLMTIPF